MVTLRHLPARVLIQALRDIESGCESYQVGGVRSFKRTLDEIMGRFLSDLEVQEEAPRNNAAWEGFKALLAGVDRVVRYTTFAVAMTTNPALPWTTAQPTESIIECLPPVAALEPGSVAELAPGEILAEQ